MNGVYLQLHAYLCCGLPFPISTLNARQMRMLAHIARQMGSGLWPFHHRQNIQFNWPALTDIPDILDALASVEMHAIQTSGNCVRNVTTDHFARVAADEIADPRVYAEILRQWSSLHPEFSFLPRKFKIAITGANHDRAAIQVHDIGLQLQRNAQGETGFAVHVGGGQGRTPMVARLLRDFPFRKRTARLCRSHPARLQFFHGRRDNKYKARIKMLVHETGIDELRRDVEREFSIASWPARPAATRYRCHRRPFSRLHHGRTCPISTIPMQGRIRSWLKRNTHQHKARGHASSRSR
ncbi:MAG: nitrite/sulfite reductase [Nitratireductor sp.]